MKKACPLLLAIGLLLSYPGAGQRVHTAPHQPCNWFSFRWMGYTVANQYFDKAAILVPVQLNGLKGNMVAQFDLGSNITILYGNTIKNYFPSRSALLALTDTTKKETNESGIVVFPAKGINIAFGKNVFHKAYLYDNYGDDNPKDSLYTPSPKLVGTIGGDVVKDKILIIDYPNRRMCLLDTLDNFLAGQTVFVQAGIHNNRIHIPITVDGQTYWLLFDTGASIFPLSTDSLTWQNIVGAVPPKDSMLIDTWGTKAMVYGAPAHHDMYLGQMKLAQGEVWYSNFKPWLDIYHEAKISGTAGNAFFFNDIVVIDFKHQRFGVVKHAPVSTAPVKIIPACTVNAP